MNIHAAAAYAAHLLTARSMAGHGVHSPLMFSFITEIIGGLTDKEIMTRFMSLRSEMLSDRREVMVTDLGAGSLVMRRGEVNTGRNEVCAEPATDGTGSQGMIVAGRSIRKIASAATLPPREAGLLARIAQNLDGILEKECCKPGKSSREAGQQEKGSREANQQGNSPREAGQPENSSIILELGTSLGLSTLALALGAPSKRIVTVEGCPELAAIARQNLRRYGADNAEVLNMEFSQALIYLKNLGTKVEMAFIDGNHRGKALADYINEIREMGDEMIIVADDIHMNLDMIRYWRSLTAGTVCGPQSDGSVLQTPDQVPLATSQAPASLETFRLGMLFFLHNLTPGRYRIRY